MEAHRAGGGLALFLFVLLLLVLGLGLWLLLTPGVDAAGLEAGLIGEAETRRVLP